MRWVASPRPPPPLEPPVGGWVQTCHTVAPPDVTPIRPDSGAAGCAVTGSTMQSDGGSLLTQYIRGWLGRPP